MSVEESLAPAEEQISDLPDSEQQPKRGFLAGLRGRGTSGGDYDFGRRAQVNLLPDSVIQDEKTRRAKIIAASMIGATLLVLVVFWLLAQQQVRQAQRDVAEQQAIATQLTAELARYADVPRVYTAREEADLALSQAMGAEILWSQILNNLSYVTPDGVKLDTMTADSTAGAFVAGGSGTGPIDPTRAVANLTYNGEALSYSWVSSWLLALDEDPAYLSPTLLDSATREDGTTTFASRALLSPDALSGRYLVEPPPEERQLAPDAPAPEGEQPPVEPPTEEGVG